jgi:hypothetical protein
MKIDLGRMKEMMNMQKNEKQKGFTFTMEAIIALLLFALMLFALPAQKPDSLKELLALQQANDLLRVWSITGINETEMINGTKQLFGENAELWINETKLLEAQKTRNSIATEGIIWSPLRNENKIKVVIYYN